MATSPDTKREMVGNDDMSNPTTKRAIFGDFGGSKADYTLGTCYASRRTYLVPSTEPGANLRPPEFLRTVRLINYPMYSFSSRYASFVTSLLSTDEAGQKK